MVSVLDSGSGGAGSSIGSALCSWARHFTHVLPVSTLRHTLNGNWRVYYWGNPCDGLASHLGVGGGV